MSALQQEPPQHMRALARANDVRLARAELKRRIAAGDVQIDGVVLNCSWEAETMRVIDLLACQRQWGLSRARRFLARVPLVEGKTLGGMTLRQRSRVVQLLRGEVWS